MDFILIWKQKNSREIAPKSKNEFNAICNFHLLENEAFLKYFIIDV